MKTLCLGGIRLLGGLLLFSATYAIANEDDLLDDVPTIHIASEMPEPAAPIAAAGTGWWGRAKKALQVLTPCAMGSAAITLAILGGAVGPLGVISAGVMIFICL